MDNAKRTPGLGTLLAILVKGAKLVKVVKIFKALKLVKFAGTFLSMGLSVFVYSFLMGPWFALGFVLLLFAHEMGHVLAMRVRGYPTSAPVFIPMLGAAIFVPGFRNRDDEAFIGFGGPLAGALASAALLLWWQGHPGELVLRLAYTSAFINLFNLLPIRPLDGGRVLQVVGSWTRYIAIAVLAIFSWAVREPSMLLIWILVLDDIRLHPRLKMQVSWACWFGMTAMMFSGMGHQHWLVNAMDMVLGGTMSIMYWDRARKAGTENEPTQPNLPVPQRLWWAGAYGTLGALLVTMMAGSTPASHRPAVAFALGVAVFLTAARATCRRSLSKRVTAYAAFASPRGLEST